MDIDAANLAAAALIGLLAAVGYMSFEWLKLRRSHVAYDRQATMRAGLRAFLGVFVGFTLIALYRLHTSAQGRGMDIVLGLVILLVLAIPLYLGWHWWQGRRAEDPPARSTEGPDAALGPRRRCDSCGIEKPGAEFPAPAAWYCNACGVALCLGCEERRPFAEFDDLSVDRCRRCAWKVCLGCGERKPYAEYIKGTAREYCRACGLVTCRGCGQVKPVSEYAPGQEVAPGVRETSRAGWFCRACGSAVCTGCGIKLPLRDFRNPAHEPNCRDCDVRPLSEPERAALEREEQDYRRGVKEGHKPTEAEWRKAEARRAALLGVSLRRYNEASNSASGCGGMELLWYPIYLVSAVLVGVFALVAGLTASPPELLPIALTILLLCAWFLLWAALVEPAQAYENLRIRAELAGNAGCLYDLALFLSALLLPVLSYMLVRIVLGSWP